MANLKVQHSTTAQLAAAADENFIVHVSWAQQRTAGMTVIADEQLVLTDSGLLTITDVNREYLQRNQLRCEVFSRGVAWLDTGTHESLLQAANFIEVVEQRQGLKIACLEEVAYRMGYIGAEHLERLAGSLKNEYGRYLLDVLREGNPR